MLHQIKYHGRLHTGFKFKAELDESNLSQLQEGSDLLPVFILKSMATDDSVLEIDLTVRQWNGHTKGS